MKRSERNGTALLPSNAGARYWLVLLALLIGVGCRRESSSKERTRPETIRYGDPIGIQVSGPGIPAVLAAVAVTERRSAEPLVQPLASQLYAAVSRCPKAKEFLLAKKPLVLRLETRADTLSPELHLTTGIDETAIAVACVEEALSGGKLPGAADLRLMVELRLDPSP
ncbi:MAG: hypothetical protein ACOY0T_06035 [Myxococcota bacterium]